jgi:MSHA pilin protein MshA
MKQKGFTLIEMIVVIVLLAILSVVAVPRFINLSDEAKAAAVAGLAQEITAEGRINFAGFQLSGIFDFGPSTPATSSKVVSTSTGQGACTTVLGLLFGLSPIQTTGFNGMSITADTTCVGGGLSAGQSATCRILNLANTQISAIAYVPCTD